MTSVVAQAVTLPTAALAVEAGPLRGKSEPTEGMPRRELVEYPVRITASKVCMSLRLFRLLVAFGFVL